MFISADNKEKLFSLLLKETYDKEHLLLPESTSGHVIVELQNDKVTNDTDEEKLVQTNLFPAATGYIKYPSYDFF